MDNYDPLTKTRKWLTTSRAVTNTGKYFADAKGVKDLADDIEHGDNFVGTMSEWNALSTAEKIKYKTADIINIPISRYALEFSSDDSFTLSVDSPQWDGTIEYSVNDGDTWSTWDGSQLSGDTDNSIYLRGSNNTKITGGNNSAYAWTFTGKYCTGNIETLLDYQTVLDGQHPVMAAYCYYDMFYGCTSLETAPELPATTLTNECYRDMFNGCTSLVTAPELPATTLASTCYGGMFRGCTSLKVAPELPATVLVDSCYRNMFYECTSLTTVPKLSATTLAVRCCFEMFYNCTSLVTVPKLLPATTLAEYCYNNMFMSCTSLKTAPELPATTLAAHCYNKMFYNCTSLVTVPKLPAITLSAYCYINMFYGCTSLKLSATQTGEYQYSYRIPTSDNGTEASNSLYSMFGRTGGTFTGTPTINTTYYTDHQPIG